MQNRLWIVGKMNPEDAQKSDVEGRRWEFQGVFSTEVAAVSACSSAFHFVGPATLNRQLPDELIPWNGAYYPKAQPPS